MAQKRTAWVRWLVVIALPVVLLLLLIPLARQHRERQQWHTMAVGKLAALHVERVLYKRPGSDDFFLRVRITNTADRPLGVSLANAVYPQSLLAGSASTRFQLRSAKLAASGPAPASKRRDKSIVRRYRAGELMTVPPGHTKSYFSKCQYPWSVVRQAATVSPFTLLLMDGSVPVTDGQTVDSLSFMLWTDPADGTLHNNKMVFIPNPVQWKTFAAHAHVLGPEHK